MVKNKDFPAAAVVAAAAAAPPPPPQPHILLTFFLTFFFSFLFFSLAVATCLSFPISQGHLLGPVCNSQERHYHCVQQQAQNIV